MREILFRGKHAVSGEWIYGDLLCSKGNYYIHERGKPIVSYVSPMAAFGTVGEWTGLTDKNGVKIFEGDIVQYQPEYWCEPTYSVVEYCADKYNYPAFDLEKHDYEANGLQCAHEEGTGCEVIGNIFDNLELLEVKK